MESTNKILKDILSAKGVTPSDAHISTNDIVRAIAVADDVELPAEGPMSIHDILEEMSAASDTESTSGGKVPDPEPEGPNSVQ